MREINFRGKDIKTGEWLCGDLVHAADGKRCAILVSDRDSYDECEVIPDTIGQFTGLCDKNGEGIYEGDIVRISIKPTFETSEANRHNSELMGIKMPEWMDGGDIIARVSFFDCAFHFIHLQSYLPGDGKNVQEPMLTYLFHERHPDNSEIFHQTIEVIGNIIDNPELLKGGNP